MLVHTSPISGLATYQDQYIATAGYDSRVILWDAQTTTPLASGNHDHLVNQCHFSSNGKYLVTSSADYSARVWSLPDMQLVSILNGHSDDVVGVAFHPESLHIATTSYDHHVCIFKHTGELLHRLAGHTSPVLSVQWQNHKTLVTSGDDGTVRRWDAELGKLIETIDLGDIETDAIAIGEEGRIYAGNDKGCVMLISNKQVLQQLSAHRAGVKSICYSSAHAKLLTLSYDHQAILWKIGTDGTFELEHTFSLPHLVWARCCAFLGESRIIFGTFGSSYGIYDLRESRWHLEHVSDTKGKNAVLSLNQNIYSINDAGQVLCNEEVINQVPSLLNFLVLCEDTLITGGHSGAIFNAKTGELIYKHHSPLNCAAVFKKGSSTFIIVGAYTGEGILLKKSGEQFQHTGTLMLHKNAIKSVACSAESIYSVCATGAVAFHSIETFELQKFLRHGHDKIVDACVYIGQGQFASTGRDFSLRITSLNHQEIISTPHKSSPKCIAFAEEEELVATGAYRGEIHIYSLRHKTWRSFRPTTAGISSLYFDRSQKLFLACSYDGRIYEISTNHPFSDGPQRAHRSSHSITRQLARTPDISMKDSINKLQIISVEPAMPAIKDEINVFLSDVECWAKLTTFSGLSQPGEHFAFRFGEISDESLLVRIHSECITGDLFSSGRCDCGPQLRESKSLLSKKGGILLYLRQEGRGIGLYEKVKAYRLQDSGFDTFEANLMLNHPEDARDFKVAAEMLKALGISQVTLISNNPDKRKSLEQNNIHVTLQIPTKTYCTPHNQQYLEAKKERMGHLLFFDYKQAVSLVNWGVK